MSRLISRLRQLHTSDGTIAAHVRETLVESLYASPQSLVIGALTSSAITMTVAAISGNGLMLGVALTIAAVAAIRIIDVMRTPNVATRPAERPRHQELIYRAGAQLFRIARPVRPADADQNR